MAAESGSSGVAGAAAMSQVEGHVLRVLFVESPQVGRAAWRVILIMNDTGGKPIKLVGEAPCLVEAGDYVLATCGPPQLTAYGQQRACTSIAVSMPRDDKAMCTRLAQVLGVHANTARAHVRRAGGADKVVAHLMCKAPPPAELEAYLMRRGEKEGMPAGGAAHEIACWLSLLDKSLHFSHEELDAVVKHVGAGAALKLRADPLDMLHVPELKRDTLQSYTSALLEHPTALTLEGRKVLELLLAVVDAEAEDGHCCIELSGAWPAGMTADKHLALHDNKWVYRAPIWRAECDAASFLSELSKGGDEMDAECADALIAAATEARPDGATAKMSTEQREALSFVIRRPVSCLTGGPGTGKTTLLRALLEVLEQQDVAAEVRLDGAGEGSAENDMRVCALLAFTHVAVSKLRRDVVLTERDLASCQTLDSWTAAVNRFIAFSHTLSSTSTLVIDESSMVSAALLGRVCRAAKALGTVKRVIFVGDAEQLQSISCGAVLEQLTRALPTKRLTHVFRQDSAAASLAAGIAAIREEAPVATTGSDFVVRPYAFVGSNTLTAGATAWADATLAIVTCGGVPLKTAAKQLQALCDTNAAAAQLNVVLRDKLNPKVVGQAAVPMWCKPTAGSSSKGAATSFDEWLREGDRVICTASAPDKGVYKGMVGYVRSIALLRPNNKQTLLYAVTIQLDVDGSEITFEENCKRDTTAVHWIPTTPLALAYAITIHKSQGSEYPHCLVAVTSERMTYKRLVYTAVTRSRRTCTVLNRVPLPLWARHSTPRRSFLAALLSAHSEKSSSSKM